MSQPPMRRAPTTSLVGRAWLKTVLAPQVGVDRALPPEATADIQTYGFVVVDLVGGSPDRYVPLRRPVLGCACWVAPPADDPSIVQWNAAEQLANSIVRAAQEVPVTGVWLVLGDVLGARYAAYRPAWVRTVIPLTEPREGPDDPGNYARFDLDIELNWTET